MIRTSMCLFVQILDNADISQCVQDFIIFDSSLFKMFMKKILLSAED